MRLETTYRRTLGTVFSLGLSAILLSGCGGEVADPPAASIASPQPNAAPVAAPAPVSAPASNNVAADTPSKLDPPVQQEFQVDPKPTFVSQQPAMPEAPRNPAVGEGDIRVAQNQPAEVVEPRLPPPMSAAELAAKMDLSNVPDGTPEELLKYMTDLLAVPFPDNATPEELRGFAVQVYSNILAASDKLLAAPVITTEQARAAVQYKFNAYEMLKQILPEQSEAISQERIQFAQAIAQSKDPNVARFARLFLFEQMLQQFAEGNQDLVQPVLEDAQYIVKDPNADVMHFGVAENAATVFARLGHSDKALTILELMKATWAETEDPKLAQRVATLDDMVLQFKIVGSMMDAANGDEEAGKQLVQNIRTWITTQPKENLEPLQMLSTIEMQMEDYGRAELARQLTGLMTEYYGNHSDPQVVKSVQTSVGNAEKRIGLVGQPFEVVGNLITGQPFEWEKYRGKYVLVDFWATWCPICLEEMENIKDVYARYKSKGFEVVGVNLDDNIQARNMFFSQRGLPWATVVAADTNQAGFQDPNAARCGVEALPFLVFVGPDGTVVEINPRGERLEELLQSVLSQDAGGVGTLPGGTAEAIQPGATQPTAQPSTADSEISVRTVR